LPLGGKKDEGDKKPADSAAKSTSSPAAALGGLTSRLPFGKKDDAPAKPADKKPADSAAKSGPAAALGGLTSRLPFGKKEETPPAKPSSSGAKPTSSPSGALGGLTSRLPFGAKKEDPPAAKPGAPAAKPSASGSKPAEEAKSSPFGRFRSGAQSAPSGNAPTAKAGASPAKASAAKAESSGGLLGRFLPFGKAEDTKSQKTSKTRASKIPQSAGEGMSLDTQLDILGVGLVFAALVISFSSLSPDQGAITGGINAFVRELLGRGALGIPVSMMAVGIWLIARHFGENAPTIDPVRISGILMLYVGALVIFQYTDAFRAVYVGVDSQTYRLLVDQLTTAVGSGGGRVGAELYILILSNVGDIGSIFVILGWMVIGLMLATRTTAAELAVFVISIYRSLQITLQRRAQVASAKRAEAQLLIAQQAEAARLQAAQISIMKPAQEALPAPLAMPMAALPAPSEEAIPIPIEERGIPIRIAGQMVTAPVGNPEAPLAQPFAPQPAAAMAAPAPAATPPPTSSPEQNRFGGIASRLRGATEESKLSQQPAANGGDAAKPASGVGGFFRRTEPNKPDATKTNAPPVPPLPTQAPAAAAQAAPFNAATPPAAAPLSPAAENTNPAAAARVSTPPAPPTTLPTERAASPFNRPGESGSPFSRPASPFSKPPSADDESSEDEMLSRLAPARPKGTGPAPRPQPTSPFASRFNTGISKPADDELEDEDINDDDIKDEDEKDSGLVPDRMSRLNEIRAGQTARPAADLRASMDDEDDVEDDDLDDEDNEDRLSAQLRTAPSPFNRQPLAPRPFGAPAQPAAVNGESAAKPFSPFVRSPEEAKVSDETQRPAAYTPPSVAATTTPPAPANIAPPERKIPQVMQPAAQATSEPVINATPSPASAAAIRPRKEWRQPDFRSLLASGSEQDFDREALVKRARTIEETLLSFGAPGRVVEINTGPVITQFGVEPDYLTVRGGKKNRVKVSAIAQLDKDLQLALGARSIRIEAPVPGKGYVGVEVPNDQASLVSLRDVMESRQFHKIKSPLKIALGQSVDGTPISADLASMPHLLIAGTTGSGKSVCVNSIIMSLILQNTPETVKFIMVDPKRVELTGYNGIPHLVAPVVVELERIVGVLKWVTREMDERYKKFSDAGARNIEDYNTHLSTQAESMAYIVVIIDELADLMMLAPDETERVITRIAALARATGIHLVIATQRPSVDVVTGLIKANFPARIAFAVAGSVDSRVILDQPGAERLLGRGDMLYMSGDSPAPVRLQGVYVSDAEINNITRYWRGQQPSDAGQQKPITALVMDGPAQEARSVIPRGDRFMQSPPPSTQAAFWDADKSGDSGSRDDDNDSANGDDELYGEAVEMVRRLGKASVSLLQRRLRIGYTRAARLIDVMEAQGIIGPATEGSKPREVLPFKK